VAQELHKGDIGARVTVTVTDNGSVFDLSTPSTAVDTFGELADLVNSTGSNWEMVLGAVRRADSTDNTLTAFSRAAQNTTPGASGFAFCPYRPDLTMWTLFLDTGVADTQGFWAGRLIFPSELGQTTSTGGLPSSMWGAVAQIDRISVFRGTFGSTGAWRITAENTRRNSTRLLPTEMISTPATATDYAATFEDGQYRAAIEERIVFQLVANTSAFNIGFSCKAFPKAARR